MFPRNAATCKKCFRVFCCRIHRKDHEGRCCAQGLNHNIQMNPAVELKVHARLLSETADKKQVCSKQNIKRKFGQRDSPTFLQPICATAIHASRKMIKAARRRKLAHCPLMVPNLPSLKEEDDIPIKQPNETTNEESAKIVRSGGAYNDFKRGFLSASPITLSIVPIGSSSKPPYDSASPAHDADTPVEASATPLALQVPRSPHLKASKVAGVFKTSTPKDDDEKPETHQDGGAKDEQGPSIPPFHPRTTSYLTDSMEDSPITSELAVEESNMPVNRNKETILVNSVAPFIPATPMTSEAPPVRHRNLMEGLVTSSENQLEEQPGPSTGHVGRIGQTLLVGDLPRPSPSNTSCATPFAGKKKVSWSSDTYETATPYFSARSHFSFCPTPVTPLQNPTLFTSVKDAFKNLVCLMPGTSDTGGVAADSPSRKRLKLVAESKIKCRPTYKGRYPKSRSYLVFNDE